MRVNVITTTTTTGGPFNTQAVSFPGDTRESIFQVRHGNGENLKKFVSVDGGDRTHDPKKPWSVDDAICSGNSGVLLIVRLTTCKRLTTIMAYPN